MKEPTKKQLKQEIKELRRVGTILSNIAYNLGQPGISHNLDEFTKELMWKYAREWDNILKADTNWSKKK